MNDVIYVKLDGVYFSFLDKAAEFNPEKTEKHTALREKITKELSEGKILCLSSIVRDDPKKLILRKVKKLLKTRAGLKLFKKLSFFDAKVNINLTHGIDLTNRTTKSIYLNIHHDMYARTKSIHNKIYLTKIPFKLVLGHELIHVLNSYKLEQNKQLEEVITIIRIKRSKLKQAKDAFRKWI
jgi:hypothetical protein